MPNPKQFAEEIIRTLRGRGLQAYLAGGCVRDLLLNREPADYDVATDATPRQLIQIFPETYAVGEQFGVVLVPYAENDGATSNFWASPSPKAISDKTLALSLIRAVSNRSKSPV